jgi:hypothetical protein
VIRGLSFCALQGLLFLPRTGCQAFMKVSTNDLFILMVIFAVLMFFGMATWMIVQNITNERVHWMFDIFSAFLFILVFFWLFILEEPNKGGE